MSKFAVVLCAVLSLTFVSAGQTTVKSVTNADLEKYRQIRVNADREYRETYASKGLPSPEEIARRNDVKQKEMQELADKLRQEALERQRLAAEIEARRATAARNVTVVVTGSGYDGTVYSGGYLTGGRFGRRSVSRIFAPQVLLGYAAGGVLWPAPVGQKPPYVLDPRPVRRPRH